MKRYALACAIFFGIVALAWADDTDKAMKELNGVYSVKSFTKGGMPAPEEVIKGIKSFTMKDGKIEIDMGERTEKGDFKVNAKEKPAHIDVSPTTGGDVGKTWKGIYKLEKGTLTICLNHGDERPKDFDEKGDKIGTIVLQKKEDKK